MSDRLVVRLEDVGRQDVVEVGGKNASLGELLHALVPKGVAVPPGFAVTATAYRRFLREAGLDAVVAREIAGLDPRNTDELQRRGRAIREAFLAARLPAPLEEAIAAEYARLCGAGAADVAVRSSATAEDLPEASFAGQQESFLNVSGAEAVVESVKRCFASLFTDRAISYRAERGFPHERVALSVGVQRMVRADLSCSGVLFTLDTESGFRDVVLISAAYGLGENVVQGAVGADEYCVFKPALKAGFRPILRKTLGAKEMRLVYDPAARVRIVRDVRRLDEFQEGEVLVAEKTDPDWEPVMRKAAAVVTDRGGRTCHAAIVSRELGLPAVVGAEAATKTLRDGQVVTVSCAEGETGRVYDGRLPFSVDKVDLKGLARPKTKIMMNVADPEVAFGLSFLPHAGVGLARMEFIVSDWVKIHPLALLHPEKVQDPAARAEIARLTEGWPDKAAYFVDKLAQGAAVLAAAFSPHDVILRLSDFKTNEYAHPRYREGFALECRAALKVRAEMGLKNLKLMIPFCRTVEEGEAVLAEMAKNGLRRGEDGLEVYVMCEIPSNVILADRFCDVFDGFSIGSNDLTQLILGVDRDSEIVAPVFDERNEAVKRMIASVIRTAKARGRKIGICGQAPSDYPDFARFLIEQGIDSLSLNPDAVLKTTLAVLEAERLLERRPAPR